jgi:hypothetical protein
MTAPSRATQRFTGNVAIEIHCRRCGRAFVPSAEAIRSGPEVYRLCPECRPESQMESHQGESQSPAAAASNGQPMSSATPHEFPNGEHMASENGGSAIAQKLEKTLDQRLRSSAPPLHISADNFTESHALAVQK